MNFELVNKKLLKNKKSIVEDKSGLLYILNALLNQESLDYVDFDSFKFEDIEQALTELYQSLLEDEDDMETMYILPNTALGYLVNLTTKMFALEEANKVRMPSPYRFL